MIGMSRLAVENISWCRPGVLEIFERGELRADSCKGSGEQGTVSSRKSLGNDGVHLSQIPR